MVFIAMYHSIREPRWTSLLCWIVYWYNFIWFSHCWVQRSVCFSVLYEVWINAPLENFGGFIWAEHIRKLKTESSPHQCSSKTSPLFPLPKLPADFIPDLIEMLQLRLSLTPLNWDFVAVDSLLGVPRSAEGRAWVLLSLSQEQGRQAIIRAWT